jgi:hypothetical protein
LAFVGAKWRMNAPSGQGLFTLARTRGKTFEAR